MGNFIGINTISGALGNSTNGVEIAGTSNTIGGTAAADRDIISGNTNDGVLIDNGATGNQVMGEFIGTATSGNTAVANGNNGIEVAGTSNIIGSTASGSSLNVISGNHKDGVLLDSTGSSNFITRSYLGLALNNTALANGNNGLEIQSVNNTIGGASYTNVYYRNWIAGNTNDGVRIDSGANGNLVQGAFLGLNDTGTIGVGNVNGIEIFSSGNTIGGVSSGVTNAISGNSTDGVLIDSGATGNLVEGNYVGTYSNGTGALGNSAYGVSIAGSNNTIGGSPSGAGNTIANNSSGGVLVSSGSGDTISQNSIYANGPSNTGPGITIDSGANNNIVAPTLSGATLSGSTLTVTGSFTAPTANVTYVLEFFANLSTDPEGRIYLGSLSVTPTTTGTQNFTFTTTYTGTDPLITATLTDNLGDTSTFSNGVTD